MQNYNGGETPRGGTHHMKRKDKRKDKSTRRFFFFGRKETPEVEEKRVPTPEEKRAQDNIARRNARDDDKENRLRSAARNRRLQEQERHEREQARRQKSAYRAAHPGFFDPNLRLHSVIAVLLSLFAIFLCVSFLLRQHAGIIGEALASALLGCFSYTAYLLPAFLLLGAFLWRRDIRDRVLVAKCLIFPPVLLFASVFAALGARGFTSPFFSDAGVSYQNGNLLSGGGTVGDAVADFLYRNIGLAGIILLTLATLGGLLMIYFHRPLKLARTQLRNRARHARVDRARRRFEKSRPALSAEQESARITNERLTEGEAGREGQVPPVLPATEESATVEEPSARATRPAAPRGTTARRRALFADLEDDLEIERESVPSGNRTRQIFDFEVGDTRPREGTSPFAERAATPARRLRLDPMADADGESFGEEMLGVSRERVRPVSVTPPPAAGATAAPASSPAPAAAGSAAAPVGQTAGGDSGMDYFRRITVTADSRETRRPAEDSRARRVETDSDPLAILRQRPAAVTESEEDGFEELEEIEEVDYAEEDGQEVMPAPVPPRPVAPARPAAPIARPAPAPAPAPRVQKPSYRFPPLSLLNLPEAVDDSNISAEIQATAQLLVDTLESFDVKTTVTGYSRGPRITRYEVVPEAGIRVRKISALIDDISMSLAASGGVRIEAPIPGKSAVGIEVPNATPALVRLRGLLDTDQFRNFKEKTVVCLGCDVEGKPVYCDLTKLPHMLVAGATGMGKSVCINSILMSLLYKASPDEVKLIMIDPKKVEFAIYAGIPHLLIPVVTDPKKAAGALSWAVNEMERRFSLIEGAAVRDIGGYNRRVAETGTGEKLPYIIVVIDELHDLMMSAADSVETSIARIAAKARAAGIHLLIGTQRPSVDVITGTIKANIAGRIAFRVSSNTDSRTILDKVGAEKLLPRGDMLFVPADVTKSCRVQGAFVEDGEIARVVAFLKENNEVDPEAYEMILADIEREVEKCTPQKKSADDEPTGGGTNIPTDDDDQHLCWAALEVGFEFGRLSTSLLQRKLHVGYGKAAKILDTLCDDGYISPADGAKPRQILITREEFKEMMARGVAEVCGDNFD